MNKNWASLIIAFCIASTSYAQPLFTYGKYSSTSKEFLRAFNKNNTAPTGNKTKAMRDYLDLYIASRLKIREAYSRGYDTLAQIKSDIASLRTQVLENYLNDPAAAEKLLHEAFARSQKDIHVGHIFISYKNKTGAIDSAQAQTLAAEVYEKLKKGEDFFKLSQEYSSDPSVAVNKGDIGYITVFTLPYEFENVVYNLTPGKNSAPYRSKLGFHIFKNLDERKGLGKMKAAQILLAYPPNADEQAKKQVASLADSLYQLLLKGEDFTKLVTTYSNDYVSAANSGLIQEFGVGQYDPVFEKTVFGLAKDGDITKPFATDYGYHIVKRIEYFPVVTDAKDKSYTEELKQVIAQNDRTQFAKKQMMDKVLQKIRVKRYPFTEKELMVLSDSLLEGKKMMIPVKLTKTSSLFAIGDKVYTVNDYVGYAQIARFKPDGSGAKTTHELIEEYIRHEQESYYRDHLEDYNEDFRYQMSEFKDGNLFFEIMQQEVWGKAQNDTVALVNYFQKHKTKYNWKESADAIIFFCGDEATAKLVYDQVKRNPSNWKPAAEQYEEKVVADSARFEFSQIPNSAAVQPHAGLLTTPVINKTDGTVSFAYVIKTYPANMPRNFSEAKGLVINDYQAELEKQWVAALKKKYPVKINEQEWGKISK